jgi:hypothetical protein
MRKYYFFLILITGIFLYLGLRLGAEIGWPVWLGLFYIFVGVLFYPLKWLRKSSMNRIEHLWRWKAYMDLGLLCFLFSLVVLRDLVFLPLGALRPDWQPALFSAASSWIVIGISIIALLFGVWAARSGPRLKRIKIPLTDLPQGLEGFRIVQISDLHIGPTIGIKYVEKVVRIANSLRPDLTVLTGDIVDGDIDHHLDGVRSLAQLRSTHQSLMVTGNHEYYWNGPAWISAFENLGVQVLLNSRTLLQHKGEEILVAGVLDPAVILENAESGPDVKEALGPPATSAVKILLAHQPDFAHEASSLGFHLMLSGHTHGGQIFPLTLFIHSMQEFVKGLKKSGAMWVYVNQGTGYWGPPVRFGTVTEITLLELTRKPAL